MIWNVLLGDCRKELASVERASVCITDPPYSQHTHEKQWIGAALTEKGAPRVKTAHAGLGFDPIDAEIMAEVAAHLARIVDRWTLVFTDLEGIAGWRTALVAAGLDYVRTCVWDKVDGAPQFTGDRPAAGAEAIVCAHRPGKKRWSGGGRRNVFRHQVNGGTGAKPHPSTKPDALMCELVELFSEPGETILDPFCGSGSTGVAAVRLGRRFVGIEMNPKWAALSRERLDAEERGLSLRDVRAGQEPLFKVGT